MNKSLLFLPDISGFTEFIQTTEVTHSQHVISELLEVLIEANTEGMELAEIEGDALFFYKEGEIPSLEKLLAQVEAMFTAFYSHLKLLEQNRICPCNACSSAPKLQLKIIAHSSDLQFITVHNKRKPFGSQVIEAHRLMKNSVDSDNYLLLSKDLTNEIQLHTHYKSDLFHFNEGSNAYDGKELAYLYSIIDKEKLKLAPIDKIQETHFSEQPNLRIERKMEVPATQLLETITNYSYRTKWVEGIDKLGYNENEVTRVGTEHACVVNGKHIDFVTVTKPAKPNQFVYGELTTTPPFVDEIYQFYIITPISDTSCRLEIEVYWKAKSIFKKLLLLLAKRIVYKNVIKVMDLLTKLVNSNAKQNHQPVSSKIL